MISDATLLVQIAATLLMCGVIWFVQVVHYPLFRLVGTEAFVAYENEHTRRTAWVVAPTMTIELATAVVLLWLPPDGVPRWLAVIGLVLLGVVWLSTAFLQVPRHRHLQLRFAVAAHRSLVRTNWLRTSMWSLRALVVLGMLVMRKESL